MSTKILGAAFCRAGAFGRAGSHRPSWVMPGFPVLRSRVRIETPGRSGSPTSRKPQKQPGRRADDAIAEAGYTRIIVRHLALDHSPPRLLHSLILTPHLPPTPDH